MYMSFYVKGAVGSKWANKFPSKKHGRDKCITLYKEDLLKNKDLIRELSELKGKVLGCWCSPEKCHGECWLNLQINRCK